MKQITITLDQTDVMKPRPWPIRLDADYKVTSGLGQDDGALLVGFGPAGQQTITVYAEQAVADPASVVGLTATFSDGNLFLWGIPVKTFVVSSKEA